MDLSLTRPDVTALQVTVTCDGQLSHTFTLSALLPTKANGLPHPLADPVVYGTALYTALFPPNSLAHQTLATKPKRIVLVAADDTLDAIPWEYAYGPDGFVACACALVRGLPAKQRSAPPEILSGLHIVAVASNPLDHYLAPLNIQGEWIRLTEIVGELDRAVTLERVWPPTIARLRELVAGEQQRVVHFMGHGGQNEQGEAVLCFERDDGAREDVTAREFVQRVQGSVLLVTLNACESATSGETVFGNLALALVREQVPYALGMRFFVVDDDALAFARAFYSDLARGVPVEEAVRQARLTLAKSERAWAVGVPVLYTALATPVPGYVTAPGEPVVQDAHEDALRGIIGVLPEVQGAFQGRIDEQIHLGNWLTGDHRPRIITIHGSGGQGKTALARVAAERFAHAWPGGVWAITLETVPTRALFVASLARFLGISPQDSAEPADLERNVLLRVRRKRTLLVLDNLETLVEAAKAQDGDALSLAAFIQQLPSDRTSLLCTSRYLFGWSGERHLELPGLSPDEGAALFQQSASLHESATDLSLAKLLSQRVDGHPLSLFLLGKAFNETSLSLAAFVADYETFLLAAEDLFAGVEHRQRTLYANFAYSVKWLPADLRDTLSKLWVFHAPFLLQTAIAIVDLEHETRGEERSPVADQLYALWQRGLLTRAGSEEQGLLLYRVPPVIRPYIDRYLADASERETLLARYGSAYARLAEYLYGELDRGGLASALAFLCRDDLERGILYVTGIEQGYYLLHWGWVLHRLGDRTRGLFLSEQALESAQELNQELAWYAMNNIAVVYQATGHPQEALRLYEQALPITKEAGDRVGEATTRNNMAAAYHATGQPQEALRQLEQTLLIMKEVGNRAGEATTFNNMAEVYRATGQLQEALCLYKQALPIMQEVGDRAGEAATLNNMALVYNAIGRPQDALHLYEQALPIRREVGDRAGEATTFNNMAGVHYAIGKPQEALRLYKQVLPIKQEVGDRVGEATALNNMALVYNAIGQPQEALRLLEQALLITRESGDRAGEANTLANRAILLYQDGQRQQEAITDMELALDILRVTGLPQDTAGQTPEQLEQVLQTMQDGTLSRGQSGGPFTMHAKQIVTIVGNTVAVMTTLPERRAEWRETIAGALADAKQRGADWQIEVDFFTAILAILDGASPSLPADHPYAAAIAAILDGIVNGGLAPDDEDGDDVPEEVQALAMFVPACVAALRSTNPQEKMAFMQQLVALQGQAPGDEMQPLFQAMQLALFGGDLAHLGDTLTGLARQMWEMIVAGVQQDDTPPGEPPATE